MILKPISQKDISEFTGIPRSVLSEQIYKGRRPVGKSTIKRLAEALPYSEEDIRNMSRDEIFTALFLSMNKAAVDLRPGECMKAAL